MIRDHLPDQKGPGLIQSGLIRLTPSVKRNFGFRFPTVFGGFGDSIGRAESWKLGMDQNNTFLVSAL